MTSWQAVACEAVLIPLLRGQRCCNVTFVLDSSETMRAALASAKRLLIQTLLTKASLRDSFFNIIMFSGQVNCWSPHMLPCAPDTVYSALSWIRSISCSPGRDLLAALSLALTDRACHAVHVLCMDPPEQPQAVLRALPALAAGRPVNVFYLQDSVGQLTNSARFYLQCLAQATRGSCYVILVGLNGELQKVVPLYVAEIQSSLPAVCPISCCLSSSSVVDASSLPHVRCSLSNALCPATSCVWPSSEIFPGCRVLARRETDGFYYLGSVIQQVQGCTGVWVVQFDRPWGPGTNVVSSQRQLVCSLDMVSHVRVHTHSVVPGDPVLSPWEPDLMRHGPGRVMAATERRDGFGVDGVTSLRVLMWNGCVSLVPASLVLPISAPQHDRIVRELQIPTAATGRYSNWLHGGGVSCAPPPLCPRCRQRTSCCCYLTGHRPSARACSPRSSLDRTDGLERAERDVQADLDDTDTRKSEPEAPSSPCSSLSEDDLRATFPPAARLRRKQRPPWRYWRRTGPEPQHRQPGDAAPRRPAQPASVGFPVPRVCTSPNHSALFQPIPGAKGRRANMRDVLRMTDFEPQPPVELQLVSGNCDTTGS